MSATTREKEAVRVRRKSQGEGEVDMMKGGKCAVKTDENESTNPKAPRDQMQNS